MSSRIKIVLGALACVVLASTLTVEAQATRDPDYGPPSFWHSRGGYEDGRITETEWELGVETGRNVNGHAAYIGTYRISLFAKYYNFKYINIFDARYIYVRPGNNQSFWVRGIGSNISGEPFECDASKRFVSDCKQIDVDKTLAQLQPLLGMTDDDTKAELAKIAEKYPRSAQPAKPISPP